MQVLSLLPWLKPMTVKVKILIKNVAQNMNRTLNLICITDYLQTDNAPDTVLLRIVGSWCTLNTTFISEKGILGMYG